MEKTKATREMRARFPYIPKGMLDIKVAKSTYKTERGLMNHLAGVNEDCRRKAEQPDVDRITMSITWRKSRTWGYNPHLEGRVRLANGGWEYEKDISCGGCGYDKESTVMADFLNRYLAGMLWRRRNFRTNMPPYGVSFRAGFLPYFCGGVGARCTLEVLQWLGFRLTTSVHGDGYDYYELER